MERNTLRCRRASPMICQVSANGLKRVRSPGVVRRRQGNLAAREVAGHGDRQHQYEKPSGDGRLAADQRAHDGAEQYGHEGAHANHAVAADQFRLVQVLGQNRVLQWTEERGLKPKQEQHGQHQRKALQNQGHARQQGDGNLKQLDPAHDARFLVLVGDLSGHGRKQEKRQHEQTRRGVHRQIPILGGNQAAIYEEHRERRLEQVVVEGAEELGGEKRPQALGEQKLELGAWFSHGFASLARGLRQGIRRRSPDGASKRACPRILEALTLSLNTRRRGERLRTLQVDLGVNAATRFATRDYLGASRLAPKRILINELTAFFSLCTGRGIHRND